MITFNPDLPVDILNPDLPDDLKLGTVIEVLRGRDRNHGLGDPDPNTAHERPWFMGYDNESLNQGERYVVTSVGAKSSLDGDVIFAALNSLESFIARSACAGRGEFYPTKEDLWREDFIRFDASDGNHYALYPWEEPVVAGKDYVVIGNMLEQFPAFQPVIDGFATVGKVVCIKKFGQSEIDTDDDRHIVESVGIAKDMRTKTLLPHVLSMRQEYLFEAGAIIEAPPKRSVSEWLAYHATKERRGVLNGPA